MFTYFTDRDGKYQLASLAESGFDPLARTCRFMLTEEAHHMFVGETGVGRVVERTCQLRKEHRTDRIAEYGGIPLALLQKYINFHFSVSLDLFGSELSTNAANYFSAGLKGRFREEDRTDDHRLIGATYPVLEVEGGRIVERAQPALNAVNEMLRDEYIADSARGVARWNKIIRARGIDFELKLPHRAFNRRIGHFAGARVSPSGEVIDDARFEASRADWLPTKSDYEFIASLMKPETEPGKFAGWLAPPARGINHQPLDFDYVSLAH
jgi:benzoyl-CoA 2,3-dioxygenase component B